MVFSYDRYMIRLDVIYKFNVIGQLILRQNLYKIGQNVEYINDLFVCLFMLKS